jgi:Asp/Glu/hydantoin racemase
MSAQIAFIHTSPTMIPVFKTLADELLAGASIFNMVDESLLRDIIRDKGLSPGTAKRLAGHVAAAEQAGAEFILVSCSSMGRAVEASRTLVASKVLRVDEPMAEKAVSTGRRIGVIATLPSTLEPTVALIRQRAAASGKTIDLTAKVVDGAFEAVISGNGAKHDALVGDALKQMARDVDVIVLAQASMARVVDALSPADKPVPILSSPRLAVENLATLICAAGSERAKPEAAKSATGAVGCG